MELAMSLILRGYQLKELARRENSHSSGNKMIILGQYGGVSEYVLDEFLSYTVKQAGEGLIAGPFAAETPHASTISEFLWYRFTSCNEPVLKSEYDPFDLTTMHRLTYGLDRQQISGVKVTNFPGRDQPWTHVHIDVKPEDQSYDFLICRESIMKIPMYMLNPM